jgi:hypothetical protein
MVEVLDSRDGPTVERGQHGSITSRVSGLGRRVRRRREALLNEGVITPEQSVAAMRFEFDYLVGIEGREKSCLAFNTGRSSPDYMNGTKHDAAGRYQGACDYIDGRRSPQAPSLAPSHLVLMYIVHDNSYPRMASSLGLFGEKRTLHRIVQAQCVKLLTKLTLYYDDVDRLNGKSETPHTREGAIKLIVPNDQV